MSTLFASVRAALLGGFALLLASCIEPYRPADVGAAPNYLVVDGSININGVTTINLSRTYNVSSAEAPPTEPKANLYIQEEAGGRYLLRETTKGTYVSDNLSLNTAKRYQLHITTAAGKEYVSDFVPAKSTPPIDAITWRAEDTGLTIYVNSRDDKNATQYYRWDYEETWEIRPLLFPNLEYKNGTVQSITVRFPTRCWSNEKSTDIKISSTANLSRDVVSNFPLKSLPTTTNRLFHRYSILVKQYAQTREEYAYWDLLRKNTENIGTLFDPLPSQLTGNIRCLNDQAALALGYIGAHSTEEKRIFIDRAELPPTWRLTTGYERCVPPDTVDLQTPVNFFLQSYFGTNQAVPIDRVFFPQSGVLRGYTYASPDCVDCRLRGTATRPAFWQ